MRRGIKKFARPIVREIKPVFQGTIIILGTLGAVWFPIAGVAAALTKLCGY